MDEGVRAAAIHYNEAKTFFHVEEFHRSSRHRAPHFVAAALSYHDRRDRGDSFRDVPIGEREQSGDGRAPRLERGRIEGGLAAIDVGVAAYSRSACSARAED